MADEGAEGIGRAAGGAEAARVVEYKDRAAWLEARRAGIGASDAAAVIGARPSPLAIFLDKLGLSEPQAETSAMAWGRKLEPLVAAQYAEETGRRVVNPGPFTIHQSRAAETPWLMATLDRVIVDDARGPGILEIKTTHAARREDWAEEPPLPFLVQVMHQMAVTGYTWGSLAVLIGGQEFLWVDVPRNEEFIQLLVTLEARFWARVEAKEPPPPTSGDLRALAQLYPTSTAETVALPAAALDWDAELATAKREIARWEQIGDAAEAQVKAAMGTAAVGVLPGGQGSFSWKTVERNEKERPARTVSMRVFRRLK